MTTHPLSPLLALSDWILVPRNPTDEMIDACMDEQVRQARLPAKTVLQSPRADLYRAMIAAAPKCPEAEATYWRNQHAAALRVIEELRAANARGEWLPIESAPKHREVLVWREDCGAFTAKLTTPDAVIPESQLEEMEFADDFEEWWSDAYGWQEGSERPTHWMEKPAGPGSEAKS